MDKLDDHVQLQVLDRLSRRDVAALMAARKGPQVDVRGAQREMREARAMLDELATSLGAGEMDMQEWRAASTAAKRRLKVAESVMAQSAVTDPVAELLVADNLEAAWVGLDLSRRRAVIDHLMIVRVRPARRGKQPGGGYWDPGTVDIVWK